MYLVPFLQSAFDLTAPQRGPTQQACGPAFLS